MCEWCVFLWEGVGWVMGKVEREGGRGMLANARADDRIGVKAFVEKVGFDGAHAAFSVHLVAGFGFVYVMLLYYLCMDLIL